MRNGNYILVLAPVDYPGVKYRGKYVFQHRLVYWKNTGDLAEGFIIHHKDNNKHNNDFSNLEKLTNEAHSQMHGQITRLRCRKYFTCLNCKKEFIQVKRPIQKFCSRRCIGLYNYPRVKIVPPIHGTYAMYKRNCRCDLCKNANNLYMRNYKSKKIRQ